MPDKKQKEPLILRGDGFDIDFANYHFSDDERMKKFQKGVREKKFKVSDTDVKYRVVNHWEEKGLLPDNLRKDSEGWRRFSFVEFIWLKVIEQLRLFGVPIYVIKGVKDRVMWMDKKNEIYPFFEYYVAKARASTLDPYVVITQDGLSDVGSSGEIETMKLFYGNQNYILISLKKIMQDLGLKVTKPDVTFELSKAEFKILEIARAEDVDSIEIKMKDGEIKTVDSVKGMMTEDLEKARKEIMKNGLYADIKENYSSGKVRSGKVTRKYKF